MKLTDYLGDKPFWRVTVKLAIPVALQNVLTSSFQLVDTLMVSQLGDVTLSAVGMAAQWGWLCGLLGFGLCSGMSVFISQYWGVKDLKGIRRVMGIGLMLAMFVSLGFLAVALAAPTWVLGLFNQDPAVVETGCRYLRIVCFSYPAVALTYLLSNVLRGTERVRLPLYVSIVTTIANAFADYGLIFGAFGLPRLGVEGAAIATCISSWLGPVLILIFSAFEKNLLVGPVRELLDFNLKQLGEFCARALPVMSNEGLWALGMLMLNRIYANMGYEYYAGMTIFKTFSELAFAFYVGLGNACVIMVGKSIGSGKIQRGVSDARRFSVLVPLMGLVVGLTMIAAAPARVPVRHGRQSFGHDHLNGLRRDDLLLAGILLPQYLLCAGRGRVPLRRRYADGHDLRPCKSLGRRHPAGAAGYAGAARVVPRRRDPRVSGRGHPEEHPVSAPLQIHALAQARHRRGTRGAEGV